MDQFLNKGTAFTTEERDRLGLRGLLPPRVKTLRDQLVHVRSEYLAKRDNLSKYSYLSALQDRNEILFYRFLLDYMEEVNSIIYTPTVGEACLKFGALYRRPRGMFVSLEDRGHMLPMMYNWPQKNVDVVVVTDGGRILGLGDLGAHGMGIPIGKLNLYVAAGGLHPARVLPITLDVGTDNMKLRNDPTYIGLNVPRTRGKDFYEFVDEFMQAIYVRWPNVLVQFEDITSAHADPILEKYFHRRLCFNDDIQGTGAVVLSGLMNAVRAMGKPANGIADLRIVVAGAGSAGLGVSRSLHDAMRSEGGLTSDRAYGNFWLVDHKGLLTAKRAGDLQTPGQRHFARPEVEDEGMDLMRVVRKVRPHVLIGLTGTSKLFSEEVVKEMAKYCARPVIFPLSNPTSKAECTAAEAYRWTNGRALFASGSPFDKVSLGGHTFLPAQCNNMFIFPGVGLGAVACQTQRITEDMFTAAARAVAMSVSDDSLAKGILYPRVKDIRDVSAAVATAVIRTSVSRGLAGKAFLEEMNRKDLDTLVREAMFPVEYQPLVSSSDA